MTLSRTTEVPFDHLIAELAAFPVASEASFAIGATRLDPMMKAGGTSALWRAAESEMTRGQGALSLDELVSLRDRVWFGPSAAPGSPESESSASLGDYVRRLAREHLEAASPAARPVLRSERDFDGAGPLLQDARWRQAWRWMTFALPPDLLLAALRHGESGPARVDVMSPHIRELLRAGGFAEMHLHIGAALDFPLLWVAVQFALADSRMQDGAFRSPGAAFHEGRDMAAWLIRAALVRWLLARFLRTDRTRPASIVIAETIAALADEWESAAQEILLRNAVREVAAGRLSGGGPAFHELRGIYANAARLNDRSLPDRMAEVQQADPIAGFVVGHRPQQATPEMQFIAASLDYLDSTRDALFERLFWQTQRLRTIFYRHVVQRPLTPGLQWFIRTFGRLRSGKRPVSAKLFLESAAQVSGLDEGLRSLEVRTSPDEDASELLNLIASFDERFFELLAARRSSRLVNLESALDRATGWNLGDRAARRSIPDCVCDEPIEFGVVLHFTKERGGGAKEGVPRAHWSDSTADPSASDNPACYRYSAFYARKRREAQGLVSVLTSFPLSLRVIRGLDVCTDELAAPTWVFAPLFRYVRDAAQASAEHLHARNIEAPPLRTTVHAGEDFVHLLGGLRRVDEALRYLQLREGDRIGHGVALGIDAARWARSAGRLPVMREERLFDLAWEWTCCSRFDVPSDVDRMARIEREIQRLSAAVFGEAMTPYRLERLVNSLHDERVLARLGFPAGGIADDAWPRDAQGLVDDDDGNRPAGAQELADAHKFLTSPSLFRAGRVIEWVDPLGEQATLERLQAHLRSRLASLGISVEANPSSNLLIGNLGDLRRHPLWRLRPPRTDKKSGPPVAVCIGSDDPITFATNLPNEYMLLHDAMILAGLSYDEARQWIDAARRAGMETRFTFPRSFIPVRTQIALGLDDRLLLPP